MFEPRGLIELETGSRSEDEVTELVLIDGVIDLRYGEPSEIVTEPGELAAVRERLVGSGAKVTSMVLGVVAKTAVTPEPGDLAAVMTFLDALEEHEDVQRVFSNLEVSDAQLEALA
jgi:transcriptional/translational regulatory protein YebC/TACO1